MRIPLPIVADWMVEELVLTTSHKRRILAFTGRDLLAESHLGLNPTNSIGVELKKVTAPQWIP